MDRRRCQICNWITTLVSEWVSEWLEVGMPVGETKKKRKTIKINAPIENGNKSLSRSSELPGIDSDAHCSDQVCTRRKESRVSFVILTCFSFFFRFLDQSGSNQGRSEALFFFLFFYYSPSPNIQIFRWPRSKIHSGRNTIQNNIDANLSVRASCRGEKSDQNEVS